MLITNPGRKAAYGKVYNGQSPYRSVPSVPRSSIGLPDVRRPGGEAAAARWQSKRRHLRPRHQLLEGRMQEVGLCLDVLGRRIRQTDDAGGARLHMGCHQSSHF